MNVDLDGAMMDGATMVGPAVELPGAQPAVLLPVGYGARVVGAYVISGERVRFEPVVDVDGIVTRSFATAALLTALVTAGVAVTRWRRGPTVGPVTMGPGGWLSVKGTGVRRPRAAAAAPRPWWARLLRAQLLVVRP